MTIAAITDTLLTYNDIDQQLGLHRTEDPEFFAEWQRPLPPLSRAEVAELDHLSQRYPT